MTYSIRRAALAFTVLAAAAPFAWAESNGVPAAMNTAAAPAVTSGSCSAMTLIDHKEDSAISQSTTSGSFVNVPNGAVTFAQSSQGCAIVTFSASTFAPGLSRAMFIRAMLDGSTVAEPGQVLFAASDPGGGTAKARAYSFVLTNVSAGSHTIAIQYMSSNGQRVYLTKHTLTITHS